MPPAPFTTQKDPADWCAVLTIAFLALVWHRLGIPTRIYFDETHYIPAARAMLEWHGVNPEHPLLGKQMIAAAMALLGDKPLYWRLPSALFGALGLFAFSRLLWWSSGRRFATLAGTFLLATGFSWFIQSRIAMLDMVMAGLGMVGLWFFAAAVRLPQQGRWRLAIAGTAFGLALGAKWSIAPVLVLPGLAFLWLKLQHNGLRFLIARNGGPVPGITLIEAGLWLGVIPLAVYWLTYWPGFFYTQGAIDPYAPLAWHQHMLALQDSVKKLHPYRSFWYEWIGNWRAIWYLYEDINGGQRGIVLIGNPFTMLAGLPAVLWCLWTGIRRQRQDALAFALLYLVSIGFWAVSSKPIQFYYHYLLPGSFLLACLALALDDLWQRTDRWRWTGPAMLTVSAGVFLYFYPIISAAKLHNGKQSYAEWMWLDSWR